MRIGKKHRKVVIFDDEKTVVNSVINTPILSIARAEEQVRSDQTPLAKLRGEITLTNRVVLFQIER
jgi:hypothetical protein